MEAVIGAIYLDQGFETMRTFVKKFVMSNLDDVLKTKSYKDAKSELQEIVQEKLKLTPTYRVLDEIRPGAQAHIQDGRLFWRETYRPRRRAVEAGSGARGGEERAREA